MTVPRIKTLILDIETFPTEAFVWGLFDQNISLNQIKSPGGVFCWAAKWIHEDFTYFSSIHLTDRRHMIKAMWDLLDEADEVVGWNSNSFDIKILNGEFAILGMTPPSPYRKIDLMRTVKANMRFISHKLDFVSRTFGIGKKTDHEGFPLWVACMKGVHKAWVKMEEYNINDVALTEDMYHRLIPWISTGANRSASWGCPRCGHKRLHSRGDYVTAPGVRYKRYQCQGCGGWIKGDKVANSPKLKAAK